MLKDNGYITVGQVIRPGPVKCTPLHGEAVAKVKALLGICPDCNNIDGHEGECK